jgi:hypothetical protein
MRKYPERRHAMHVALRRNARWPRWDRPSARFHDRLEFMPTHLGKKVRWRLLLDPLRPRKRVRSRAHHHHVRRALHHRPRQPNRMPGEMHRGHGPGGQRASIHQCSVHLVGAVGRKGRAASCVEQRIVFQHLNGCLHGIERPAVVLQHIRSRSQRIRQ